MKKSEELIFRQDEKSKLVRTLRYTKDDYSALARCLNSFKDADSWPGGFGGNFEFTTESIENDFAVHDFSSYFVVVAPEDASKIVGTCFVAPSWNLADAHYVDLLGVDPKYQRQKLGKTMLLEATKYATEQNHKLIALDTWAGNTNAMPLYKRQGYKWRVNSSVYMENYIPQILNHPFLGQKFTQYYWYDAYKPIVDQEPNLEWYDYMFEFPDDCSLRIWVDKTIGMINGYHLKHEEEDLLIKLSVDKSEAFIGLEEFPIDVFIQNKGNQQLSFIIDFSCTAEIILLDDSQKTVKVEVGEEKKFSVRGRFPSTTNPLDMKTEPEVFSQHLITANISQGNTKYPLSIGKIPIKPLTVNPKPANFTTLSGKRIQLPIEFKNNTGSDLPIHISFVDGKYTTLDTHGFDLTVSPMDSHLKIPISIKKTESGVDILRLRISNEKDVEFIDQEISIGLLHYDKAIFFHQGPRMYMENDYLSISTYEKCQPGANFLEIYHKQKNLFISGHSLNLGLPFQEWGSEFYKIDLDHSVVENKEGIWLFSSAESKDKPGLKLTRKVFLPHNRSLYSISFTAENLGEKTVEEVAIRELLNDWPVFVPSQSTIFPFKSGIRRLIAREFQGDLGKKPSLLKEGWKILEHPTGNIGVIFDLKDPNLEAISLQGTFPTIDFKAPELAKGQKLDTSRIYYYFGVPITEIRRVWSEIYGSVEKKLSPFGLQSMHDFGLHTNNGEIAHGLILDKNLSEIQIGIRSNQKSTYKGKFTLDIYNKKHCHLIKQINPTEWKAEVKMTPDKILTSGELTIDSETRFFDIPVAIGTYDSTKEIGSSIISKNGLKSYEFENGYLEFKACESFRGSLYYIGLTGKNNLLHTFFPEVKPYLWFNRYFGGIKHMISPIRSFSELEYSSLKFKGTEITRGLWMGIEFISPIIDYEPTIKGLQTSVEYLTLPESPFLLVQQSITNHSGISRKFHAEISANTSISKTFEDQFWVPSQTSLNGIAHYHSQDYEPHTMAEKSWDAKWTAFQGKDSESILGLVSTPSRFTDLVYPYSPNMNYFTLNRKASDVELDSGENFTYQSLFIVAETLEQIYPFSQTNLLDLLPK